MPNRNDNGETPSVSNLHDAARGYARLGIAIFPCQPRGKAPLTGHGFHDATTDTAQIDAWWTATPDANIGIALGVNNVFAIDVDGPDGRARLDQLEAEHDTLPATYQVITGRIEGHGKHHLYRQPAEGPRVPNAKLGHPKLEIRGDGGYVIAPPSIHESGRPYLAEGTWRQIADPPEWLVQLAVKPSKTATETVHDTTTNGHDQHAEKRLQAVAGKVALAPEGDRNNVLNWAAYIAGQLEGAGRLDLDRTIEVLANAARRAGLADTETYATIQSGIQAGRQDPDHTTPTGPTPPVTILDDSEGTGALDALRADPDYQALVAAEATRILARQDAREQVDTHLAALDPPPGLTPLTDFLNQPDPPITYRIDRLWPADGRCLLAAQYKAGKTTTVGNVLRSLVDGDPLFGVYPVAPLDGTVVLLDDELHENTLRRWLRDQDIAAVDRIHVQHLRGRLSTFNILDPGVRARWAADLRAAGTSVVILDCLRPIIDALGLSEDKDVGRVLAAFDELLEQADVSEALIVHHMGHVGERSRGDSRLRDWPDAEWKLVRERSSDGEDDPTTPRYFSAIGRDVEIHEQRLELLDGRRLQIVGGSRKAMQEWDKVATIIQTVIDNPGIPRRLLPAKVREAGGQGKSDTLRDLADQAVRDGWLEYSDDDGFTPCVPRVPQHPGYGGTPPVTPVENQVRTPRTPPPGYARTPAPKGSRGVRAADDHRGTPPGATEVPL